MNLITKGSLAVALLAGAMVFNACKKDDPKPNTTPNPAPARTGNASIEFEHVAGTAALAPNTDYTNAHGETYRVSKLKYYVSRPVLIKEDGTELPLNQYHLIDFSNTSRLEADLDTVPTGNYKGIRFNLGVDSSRNYAGDQVGALDPANGMFWTWNTGYAFMQFEGTSPASTGTGNRFVWHYGGANATGNYLRTVSINFASTPLVIKAGKASHVHVGTDVSKIFQSAGSIKIADVSMAHGGATSTVLANNAAQAFSLDHVHNAQ